MRRLFVMAAIAACGAPPPPKSPTSSSVADWTTRCSARLEAARTKLALGGATKADPTPWNPRVRFEVHVGDGFYEASVAHGREACIDFDSDDPAFTNFQWSNGAYSKKIALDRIRRVDGDEAVIEADKVPPATIEPFRAAFESALEACLQDARGVTLGALPKDFSCMDKQDKCPDSPTPESAADGCPEPDAGTDARQ